MIASSVIGILMIPVNFAFVEYLSHRFGMNKHRLLDGPQPVERVSEGGEA